MRIKINDQKARELYSQGLTDGAIGSHFGASAGAVLAWRRKHNLPANTKRKDDSMALKVPDLNALPDDLREKVESKLTETPTSDAITETPTAEPTQANDYDPLIYYAFSHAIWQIFDRGGQPASCWRELLAAVEQHISALAPYINLSRQTMDAAIKLAAIAAAKEVHKC